METRQGLLQVRGQVRELTDQFNSLLDLPACTVLELVDPLPPDLPVRCADDAVQVALIHNPEVREAEWDVAKARAALQVARMDYLPDVNVIGGFANQTFASYIQPDIGYLSVAGSYTFWDWGKRREVKNQARRRSPWRAEPAGGFGQSSARSSQDLHGLRTGPRGLPPGGRDGPGGKDAEKGAGGKAAVQAKAETARAELEAMKAEIAYRVAHAQLEGILGSNRESVPEGGRQECLPYGGPAFVGQTLLSANPSGTDSEPRPHPGGSSVAARATVSMAIAATAAP